MGARAHMSPRLLQILPVLARVRLHRPARARLAGRGLPGRPHHGADAHHPHRARPLDPRVGQPGEDAGRALASAASARSSATLGARGCRNGGRNHPQGRHPPMSGRTLRYILVGALALAIGIPSVAVGFGEGRSLLLGKRNPSPNASRALNSETEIIASNGSYGTRQSNKRDGDGGGAIYGCRSDRRLRAVHPLEQPQGRPRVRVRDRPARRAAGSRSATPPARRSRRTRPARPPA